VLLCTPVSNICCISLCFLDLTSVFLLQFVRKKWEQEGTLTIQEDFSKKLNFGKE
jgi:hypothetical protein